MSFCQCHSSLTRLLNWILSQCIFLNCCSSPTRLFKSLCTLFLIMAHTKNTAKKCTSGSAPHVLLKISRVQLSRGDCQKLKALSATRSTLLLGGGDLEKRNGVHEALTATRATTSEDLEISSAHNEYCILCRDGAARYEDNTLFIATYFGFYNSSGLPFLNKFLSVTGVLEVSAQAEISVAPVIFIHLILVDFELAGSPFEFAHRFLKLYYSGDGIKYIEVYCNIGTDGKVALYQTQICQIIKGLKNSFIWEHVVIDPFTGYRDDSKVYVSTLVNDFLDIILQP
ncbi:uncharacterized protein EDB93DRAFT_1109375 [Suillus bovinus]|uniref:uncharacterized protein n=1 Tax=Suillus bovinus TaxID=48563 RepID=UPI001B863685|nr:uncharacterized protein EDB93DRAFT_1109375 [Suillus bovinus]KAG2127257.1 hypothetical protein EDB93DRAFT_1109375 [Suillus bovinus]